jgi:hypothetical protein
MLFLWILTLRVVLVERITFLNRGIPLNVANFTANESDWTPLWGMPAQNFKSLRYFMDLTLPSICSRHLILSCQGHLHIFPFDDPQCSFAMESSKYQVDNIYHSFISCKTFFIFFFSSSSSSSLFLLFFYYSYGCHYFNGLNNY